MFQGFPQGFEVPFPYKGIDANSKSNPDFAKYIQNILLSDNRSGQVRYGTSLVASIPFNEDRKYQDILEIINYLKVDGSSEQLVYLTHLEKLRYIDHVQDILVEAGDSPSESKITIDISARTAEEKSVLNKIIFDDVRVGIIQPDEGIIDIHNVTYSNDEIVFYIGYPPDFFSKDGDGDNEFELWIERGVIYRIENNATFTSLSEDLDPNVLVFSVTFDKKMIICNGVDPVKVYDGTNIIDLECPAKAAIDGNITVNTATITFSILENGKAEFEDNVKAGDKIILIARPSQQIERVVSSVNFAAPNLGKIAVTVVVTVAVGSNDIRSLIYYKKPPVFSYITVGHDRMWALPEGRVYKNKFRSPQNATRVYYSYKVQSYDGWFNETTNTVPFLDTSRKSPFLDNIEVIKIFEGKTLFIGRETTQVWVGQDPNLLNANNDLNLVDFRWVETIEVGIKHPKMIIEIPNVLIYLSNLGVTSISTGRYRDKITTSEDASVPIDYYLANQLSFIDDERDYRGMRAYAYPYGKFFGLKIKYSSLIFQLSNEGGWTVFTENFSEGSSFVYNNITQTLLIGLKNGIIVKYSDKVNDLSYEEYNHGKISWLIVYSWLSFGTTWSNAKVFISAVTYKPITVNIRLFLNNDETISQPNIGVEIVQKQASYDQSLFNASYYAYQRVPYSHESLKFSADSIMVELSGLSNDKFVFDKIHLAGGAK